MKLISSRYNVKTKIGSYYFCSKATPSEIFHLLGLSDLICVIENLKTNDNQTLLTLYKKMKKIDKEACVYEIEKSNFDVIDFIFSISNEIDILAFEPKNLTAKAKYLGDPVFYNGKLIEENLFKVLIDINKFEQEIFILLAEKTKDEFIALENEIRRLC